MKKLILIFSLLSCIATNARYNDTPIVQVKWSDGHSCTIDRDMFIDTTHSSKVYSMDPYEHIKVLNYHSEIQFNKEVVRENVRNGIEIYIKKDHNKRFTKVGVYDDDDDQFYGSEAAMALLDIMIYFC